MLDIACVQVGNYAGRGWEYVSILADMISRNMPPDVPYRFFCLTDDPDGCPPCAMAVRVRDRGWWSKLKLFEPNMFTVGNRVLYFDLDTLITGELDDLAAYKGDFAMLQDAYRPGGRQSSVMAWKAGEAATATIWKGWVAAGHPKLPGGDQEWLEKYRSHILQGLIPGMFASFKGECQNGPGEAAVVFFHGHPRPHEAPDQWVRDVWKIGGLKLASVRVRPNTPVAKMFRNVKRNSRRPMVPWLKIGRENKAHAIIVGGGPSLEDTLEEIQWRTQQPGQLVFALNRAAHYLFDHGVKPDFGVIMDARGENVAFANPRWAKNWIVASMVSPTVIDRLQEGAPVTIFHPVIPGIQEHIPEERHAEAALIGGGTTVGITTMGIAWALGFRMMHLYGFDSSFRAGKLHAYKQVLTHDEGIEMEVTVGDQPFVTTPTMFAQARTFMSFAKMLAQEHNVLITVHGDGLLPALVKMASATIPVTDKMKQIGGFWWPIEDEEAHPAILTSAMTDIDRVLRHVPGRSGAVQAGGNVGVYPKALARHFANVWTFEPDPENIACAEINLAETANVHLFKCAVGAVPGRMLMYRALKNVGAHQMDPAPVTEMANDTVPVDTIDNLRLTACDLIWLDVEGFEKNALLGALETIKAHRPVIVVEDKGLSTPFGTSQGEVVVWLESLGYLQVDNVGRDYVLAPKERVNG